MRRLRFLLPVVFVLALPGLPAAGAGAADAVDYRIPFTSGTVDPARDLVQVDPAGHDLVLVQWKRFGDTAAVHAIAGTGALLVQPLAPVSYLVWADAAQTRAIRRLEAVRFAGVLPASARVAPSVTPGTGLLRVTLVGGGADLPGLPAVSRRARAFTDVDGAVAVVPGGLAEARRLAAAPSVYSVAAADDRPALRDEQSGRIVAYGRDAPLRPGYRQFLDGIGADGSGVTIAIVDSGQDFGHPDLADRKAACLDYLIGGECVLGNSDDVLGHGTHVLGNIVGTGVSGFADDDKFRYGLGVAPGAMAVGQNAISAYDRAFANGFRPVYRDAQRLGAIVSNNSWGPSGRPKGYDADTREFDTIVRDVDEATPGDQPIALSWSIMNGRGGTSTQGTPDEAKNIIAVGGSGARSGLSAPGPDDLCTCTAHGPNLDGRRLVDLVAPAQNVVSTRARQGVVCGSGATGVTTGYVPLPPSPLHGPCTGTSFASPHVTGAYAVFVDWFRDNVADDGDATPSPALVKAALVNDADDLAGGRDADGRVLGHIPDERQGWGRLNLGNVVASWRAGAVFVDQSVVFTTSGQTHELVVEAMDPSRPLKATLVWTDAPGPGMGGALPAWVNDLDLRLEAHDARYLGNVFSQGFSVAGGQRDGRNNVENVFVREPGSGRYRVTVEAANIIGKASPSAPHDTWQDFALVVTNARAVGQPGSASSASTTATRS